MLKKRQLILAKIESVYGTDSVPTPEANAILASEIEFSVVGRRLERAAALPWMGKHPALNIGEGLRLKFKTEIRGMGGDADVPPEFGCLLQSCNFTETITPDTSVEYELNSLVGNIEGAKSSSIYYYQDKKWHKLIGCRGTVSENGKAGEYGTFTFEMTGIYMGAANVSALPTGTAFNETLPPRFVSANFLIDTFAAICETLSVDLGNQVVMRKSFNAATGILEWMITDRDPKGNIDPEVPDITAASLTTALTGLNNDLVFTAHADYPGVEGNAITIEYQDTATAGAESCVVTGTSIVVGIEAGTSTASQVKTKVLATPAAMALLAGVANAAGNDGSGVVPVMAETNLSGGAGLDFWKLWEESTSMPLSWQYGSATGNKCVVAVAAAQLDIPNYADREGILTHGAPIILTPGSAGNAEIKYTFS